MDTAMIDKNSMEAVLKDVFLTHPVKEYTWVDPKCLPFSADVRGMCEANRCGMYGKSWSCPPGAGDWETLRDAYQAKDAAFLYTTCYQLEDSFDIEGMTEAKKTHRALDRSVTARLHETGISHILLGAGTCDLCTTCTYPTAPCRHPDLMQRSMEACGMDVVTLSRLAGVKYNNGSETVTYFSLILF